LGENLLDIPGGLLFLSDLNQGTNNIPCHLIHKTVSLDVNKDKIILFVNPNLFYCPYAISWLFIACLKAAKVMASDKQSGGLLHCSTI
jgi:hypothetical protein